MSFKEPNSKLVRWKLQLLEFDFEVIYKKGSQNVVADALSRVQIDVNVNDHESIVASAGDTIHSSLEETDENLFISEKPINEFKIQLMFEIGPNSKVKTTAPFKNTIRKTIYESQFTDENTTKLLKNLLRPNKICAIFTPDSVFRKIQEIYAKYFAHSKIIRR